MFTPVASVCYINCSQSDVDKNKNRRNKNEGGTTRERHCGADALYVMFVELYDGGDKGEGGCKLLSEEYGK